MNCQSLIYGHVLQTIVPLLGIAVAAAGWYVAADQNFKKNRALENARQERERRGVVRQANLLLRLAMKAMDPFFHEFMALQLNDVLNTWNRLTDLLHDRGSAVALTDADYASIEAFWSRFGKMIAMAQREVAKWEGGGAAAREYPSTDHERRAYFGQLFADPIDLLGTAIKTLGDGDLQDDFERLSEAAQSFLDRMGTGQD